MSLTCDNARSLIPSYLYGEVSEAQAAPLRAHLLGCPGCREVAKSETALQRWFVAPAAHTPSAGFAARVAQAAFQGAEASAEPAGEILPHPKSGATPLYAREAASAPLAATEGTLLSEGTLPAEDARPTQQFVLALTAAAAAVLLLLGLALQRSVLPSGGGLDASPDYSSLEAELQAQNAELERGGLSEREQPEDAGDEDQR